MNEDHDKVEPVHLIQRLVACGYPLVEIATISLLLLHSEFASTAVEALQRSEGNNAEPLGALIPAISTYSSG